MQRERLKVIACFLYGFATISKLRAPKLRIRKSKAIKPVIHLLSKSLNNHYVRGLRIAVIACY